MSIHSLTGLVCAALSGACLLACSSDSTPDSSSAGGSGASAAGAASAGASNGAAGMSAAAAGSTAATAGASNSGGSAPNSPGGASGGGSAAGGASAGAAATAGGAGGAPALACTGNATYKLTLSVTWSDAAINGRHYTTLVGGVHGAGASIWKLGGIASDGVKSMAEAGGTVMLGAEVEAAVTAGTAKAKVQFGGGDAPGTSTGMFEVAPNFPELSFGSMIAPSPDWFVGVSSLNLCEAGTWVASKTLDAVVYDAGTKDGADFDYGFPETQPRAPIAYSVKFPGNLPAGTIKIEKQ